MITQYIKNSKGQKRGVLTAEKDSLSGNITIGWSLCNKKDKFDKERGKSIAAGRARARRRSVWINDALYAEDIVPVLVKKEIHYGFADRIMRYYKEEDVKGIYIRTV